MAQITNRRFTLLNNSGTASLRVGYNAANYTDITPDTSGALTFSKAVTITGALTATTGTFDALVLGATEKLHFDGTTGGDTHLSETAANVLDGYAGGVVYLRLVGGEGVRLSNHPTTASAANVFIDSSTGLVSRSTSSVRYKNVLREMTVEEAQAMLLGADPMVYTSKADGDDPEREFIGMTAEAVAEADPRLVHLDGDGKPDGLMYERFVVPLLVLVREILDRVDALEAA